MDFVAAELPFELLKTGNLRLHLGNFGGAEDGGDDEEPVHVQVAPLVLSEGNVRKAELRQCLSRVH